MHGATQTSKAQRALSILASPRARMVTTDKGFAIFRCEDRRRRPVMQVARAIGQEWIAEGLVRQLGLDAYALSANGQERTPGAAAPLDGRGVAARAKTSAPCEGLEAHEAAALHRLAGDLEAAEIGALRGVDWSAPPRANTAWRGTDPLAAGAAARGRAKRALAALAAPLAQAVKAVCTERVTFDVLERRFHWPARSGRLAIRLAAAQLAHHYRFASPGAE